MQIHSARMMSVVCRVRLVAITWVTGASVLKTAVFVEFVCYRRHFGIRPNTRVYLLSKAQWQKTQRWAPQQRAFWRMLSPLRRLLRHAPSFSAFDPRNSKSGPLTSTHPLETSFAVFRSSHHQQRLRAICHFCTKSKLNACFENFICVFPCFISHLKQPQNVDLQ